jgi:hypothetical protein
MDPIVEEAEADAEEYAGDGGGSDEESSVEMRLSLLILEKENTRLKEENKALKSTIQTLCMNECVSKKKKAVSEATVNKWKFYHEHKEAVRLELGGDVTWRDVKRATDARFSLAATAAETEVQTP